MKINRKLKPKKQVWKIEKKNFPQRPVANNPPRALLAAIAPPNAMKIGNHDIQQY